MISTIITAIDNFDTTLAHVRGCMQSSVLPKEIVVVNDHGGTELLGMLKDLPDRKCPILYAYINEDIKWNQVGARNLGFWLSSGDEVTIEDNDHIPHPEFYRTAMEKLSEGFDMVVSKARFAVTKQDQGLPISEYPMTKRLGPAKAMGLLKRDVYSQLKGFDERFAGNYGWDITDWLRRSKTAKIKYVQTGVYFTVRDSPTKVYERPLDKWGLHYYMPHANRVPMTDNEGKEQHPQGVLNFTYTLTRI